MNKKALREMLKDYKNMVNYCDIILDNNKGAVMTARNVALITATHTLKVLLQNEQSIITIQLKLRVTK